MLTPSIVLLVNLVEVVAVVVLVAAIVEVVVLVVVMITVALVVFVYRTRFPSGKSLGEWRKDILLLVISLPDAMTICLYLQKNCPEK